jgi:hypothetical protein
LKRWAIVSHPFGMMLILSGLQPCRAQNLRDHPELGILWEQVRDEVRKRHGWK